MIYLDLLKNEDHSILFKNLDDPKINKYYMLPIFEDDFSKHQFVDRLINISQDQEKLFFGLYDDEKLVGFYNQVDVQNDTIEIGYVIFSEFHRQGYGFKGLKLLLKKLKELGFKRVRAGAFKGNEASIALLKKAGFTMLDLIEEISYRGCIYECLYFEFVIQ